MTTIDATIAMFESAEAGSRELDKAFHDALYPHIPIVAWTDGEDDKACSNCPSCSRNLQHAVDVVPSGWRWLAHDGDGFERRGFASLHPVGQFEKADFVYGNAATPQLAMCLAILKALRERGTG